MDIGIIWSAVGDIGSGNFRSKFTGLPHMAQYVWVAYSMRLLRRYWYLCVPSLSGRYLFCTAIYFLTCLVLSSQVWWYFSNGGITRDLGRPSEPSRTHMKERSITMLKTKDMEPGGAVERFFNHSRCRTGRR